MSINRQSRRRDLLIRLAGLAMLPIGAVSIQALYHLANTAPLHEGTPVEFGLAAAGFLCLSLGAALLSLGSHIFDPVVVSSRWAHRSGVGTRRQWIETQELLADTGAREAPGADSQRLGGRSR